MFKLGDVERVESVQFDSGASKLAVSASRMEGGTWDGCIYILNSTNGERICHNHLPCGNTSVIWCGDATDTVAAAGDDGNVKVPRSCILVSFLIGIS